ncbi:MAG: hypothetical protein E7551_04830 [Ruminococcaceae bacterium]|nr:hypothetical protein [Oscillospiraceae bacterium]
MKVCLIQPPYSTDYSKSDDYFNKELELLDKCDDTMDIIVLPEMTDMPCLCKTNEQRLLSIEKYNGAILEKAKETAKRCRALLFINARYKTEKGYRNTTHAFNRKGEISGLYFKQQLVPNEMKHRETDLSYVFESEEPTVVEIEGIRFGFLTCYDFYFYENYANMARYNLDVIIGCSHQRSDSHSATEIICRFLAYNTNSYVIRSSVSMDVNSQIGGGSMVVAPDGEVMLNMLSRTGLETVEVDLSKKYFKAAGFGNPPSAHYEYIEKGRRPWKYRNGGASVVSFEDEMPYPRVCAHRGFNTIAPENSMAAFGAAVAMGAQEIELDIWSTKDNVLVSCHDSDLDRVSNGSGKIYEHTYEELLNLDFGVKFGEKFKGMKIPTFEEILQKFSGRVIMNIHVKIWDLDFNDLMIEEIVSLIRKYDAERHVYFMTSNDKIIRKVMEYSPKLKCCVGWDGNKEPLSMVERAIKLGAKKIQLYKPYFNQETVDKAHENGIICNVFWSDDVEEARKYLEMGIDTILTNDFNLISQTVNKNN